ncbi:conserved hypothetical integral membrane protein [Gracilibacillus orientalis]|uniref:Conserved hypothetical integral membrane protein n=1 Tax=Gracilibacillus orientalis TaxID=334253 RepID=A0A1I4NLV4_9BACI|nr:DUF1146 family protein [Gracilibacillus orientalis]SFM16277.1 conserved hypothetical integral membrane protein [Gracilibacillus orientalis]
MMQTLGQEGLIGMLSHLIFIVITWQVLQALNFDELFRKNKVYEARILVIFITIAIGSTVSNFFLDFLKWSQQIIYLF